MSKRIALTSEQRGELVLRLLRNEATASELAREASISEPTLYLWRDKFLRGGINSLNASSSHDAEKRRFVRELEKRDQVIGEMTVAMRVLKKNLGVCD